MEPAWQFYYTRHNHSNVDLCLNNNAVHACACYSFSSMKRVYAEKRSKIHNKIKNTTQKAFEVRVLENI